MTINRFRPDLVAFVLGLMVFSPALGHSSTLPAGFTETPIGGTWTEAVGMTFDANGRMYVWEKGGRVWIVDNGVRQSLPLIDLSIESGDWQDHGLLSVALDPNFLTNGYLYLLYVVDHNYLANFGTTNYDPTVRGYGRATIGRVTRYTAVATNGFRTVDLTSRRILLGESISTGFPVLDISHGLDSLMFGSDGTLFAGCGDAAAFATTDTGGPNGGGAYNEQGVAEGIIQPQEDVGSYRAQMVDSLAGKIIRIDPVSGDGVPGNPYYDANNPRSARSRVWAMGLRNPFRMALRPGSGSFNRADANPGVLYIGDVGWSTWEELDVARGPANFGWPLYEGLEVQHHYFDTNTANLDAPNPLVGLNGCAEQFFAFQDLFHQDAMPPNWSFPNPCDAGQQIPVALPRFVHTRPAIDWAHDTNTLARTGIIDGAGQAAVVNIGATNSPVAGAQFHGNCSIGGVWYVGHDFPSNYANTYFHADWGAKWIRSFSFDTNNNPTLVQDFLSNGGGIVAVATHPIKGGLYYINWGSAVLQISYRSPGNQPPIAVASSDKHFGSSPLAVQFTGTNSTDPEGKTLLYHWNFGDGTNSSQANPTHTFSAPGGVPTEFNVTLTVTDPSNATAQATLIISANNTPPAVAITSPVDGSVYAMSGNSGYNLTASVSDAEQSASTLSYVWQVNLHHNGDVRPVLVDTNPATAAAISPTDCGGNIFYSVLLTVTDAGGLSTTNEVRLWPNCQPPAPPSALTANPVSSSQINLGWTKIAANVDAFQIERSSDGIAFTHIATVGSNVTTYADGGLAWASPFSYRVLAHNTMGDSAYSSVASATTAAPAGLPTPWSQGDIGSVGQPGNAGLSAGAFLVSGSGTDIWDTSDAFHFVYQAWNGDGKIIALVTEVENTAGFAKAGLVFRETLDASSANAMQLITPGNGLLFQSRTNAGGISGFTQGSLMTVPYWLKLERTGNFFAGYASLDGTVWTLVGSNTVSMATTIYAGLAVSAHNNLALNTSIFASVQVRPPGGVPLMMINRQADGSFATALQGENGYGYRVDTSTNLWLWTPFSTNINRNGIIPIFDPPLLPWRFYRGVRVY